MSNSHAGLLDISGFLSYYSRIVGDEEDVGDRGCRVTVLIGRASRNKFPFWALRGNSPQMVTVSSCREVNI